MKRLRMVVLLAIAAMTLFGTGCCDEERCRAKYDLIKRSECKTGHPPGPIIDIEPNAAQPGDLMVSRNGTPLPVSTVDVTQVVSVFDVIPCQLRGDFIGVRKILFDFQSTVSGSQAAQRVTVQADNDGDGTLDMEIEIRLNGFGTIRWKFTELAGLGRVCVPEPGDSYNPGDVLPKEFAHMKIASLDEVTHGAGTEVHLKVEIP